MIDDMVMRSVYLWPRLDDQLRELAFVRKISKSDLIRSAIGAKMIEWLADGGDKVLVEDLKLGQREGGNSRGRVTTAKAAAAVRAATPGKARRQSAGTNIADDPSKSVATGKPKKAAATSKPSRTAGARTSEQAALEPA